MRGTTFSLFIITCLLLSTALCAGPPKKGYKSKLCLNDLCNEPMFKAIVVKDHPSTHAQFVSAKKGDEIEVLAIQFSDRIDLMQVKTETFSGLIYMGFLDLKPYVDFLGHSIDSGRELKIVSQERAEGEKQVLGVSPANQDLVRVYNAQAAAYARLNGLEPPVPKPIPEPEQKGHGHSHSHGHSHGHSHEAGHGHSHGPEGHEHSHEAGHGHSHGSEAAAHTHEPPVTTTPPVAQQQTQPPTPTEAPRAAPPMAKAPPVQLEGNSIDEEDPNIKELMESDLRMQEQLRKAAEQAATPEAVVNAAQGVNAPPAQGAEPTQNVHSPESMVPQQAVPEAQPIVPTTDDPLVAGGQAEHQQPPPPQEPVQPVPVLDIANEAPQPVETAVPQQVGNAQPNEIPQEPVSIPTPDVPVIEAPQPPAPEAEVTLPPLSFEATTTPSPVNFPDINLPLTEAHSIPTPSEAPQGFCDNDDCRNIEAAKPAVEGVEMPLDTIVTQTIVPDSPTLPPMDTQEPVANPQAPVESPNTDAPPIDPIQHDKIIPTDVPPYPEAGQSEASTVDPFDKMNMSQIDPPIGDGLFKSMVLSMVNLARSVIPGTEGLNDAGMGIVLNLLFVCTALLMYIISYILSDGDDRIESKAAYDLSTKCIALENQLKAKESESQSGLSQRNAQDLQHMQNLQVQVQTLQHQLKQAQDRLHLSETDIQKEQSEKKDLESQLHQERQNVATLRGTVNESERRCAELKEAHDRYQAEVTKYKETSEHMEAELSSLRRERNDLVTEAKKTEDALEERRQEVENLREELKQVTSEKNRVEHELNEMAELVADYERQKSEAPVVVKESKDATTESVESGGGSNGWSDMDEDWPTVDEGADTSAKTAPQQAPAAEKPHTAQSTVDILESAKLRAQIKSLESQLKECKRDLEKEQTLKKAVEEKLSRLEDELKLKQRDLDDREHERKRATDRYDDLLSMFKDGNTKIKETEATCDRLRDQVAQLQTDMRTVDDEKRKKEDKLKETDGELKKLRNDYLRLETKHFNLSLEHKKMLDSQALSQPMMVSDLLPPLSLPSDREGATSRSGAGSRGAGSRAAAHLGVAYEPLWDEPPLLPSRNRTTSPESPSMGMEFYPQLKRGARSRRSERMRDPSPSDSDRRKSSLKEGSQHHRRVRSRSQGRQPFAPTADLPLLGYGAPSFSVRNEGGALYLSSGGSNSGRSPPPELPTRSAIPPAGLHKPKLHRPVDLNAAFK